MPSPLRDELPVLKNIGISVGLFPAMGIALVKTVTTATTCPSG
jgi:hypothetical protein